MDDKARTKKLFELLENEWCDSYVISKWWPLENHVYDLVEKKFWEYIWEEIHELYEQWFIAEFDTQEAIELWYYVEHKRDNYKEWDNIIYLVKKEVDISKAKSYKKIETLEEVLQVRWDYAEVCWDSTEE